MHSLQLLILLASWSGFGTTHFVLQSPVSLGFNDVEERSGPCGSFDIAGRDTVTSWPVGGYPVQLITTHLTSVFKIRAALINDTNTWVDIVPPVSQTSIGDFCLPFVPGYAPWVGLDAVFQMVQFAVDGMLFQCAAVVFTPGDAFPAPSACKNSTGVKAEFTSFASTVPGPTGTTVSNPSASSTVTPTAGGNGTTTQATNYHPSMLHSPVM